MLKRIPVSGKTLPTSFPPKRPEVQLATRPVSISGFHALFLGPIVTKFLHLGPTSRAELFNNGLFLGCCGI